MQSLSSLIRSGDWLTPARMHGWALCIFVISLGGAAYVIATSDGRMDFMGRPLGTDFSNVYAAGSYVLEGRAAAPFDWTLHYARQKDIFGAETQFYGWHYPPFFLFVAAALATMPYALALAVWQGVTLVLYLLAIRAILSPHVIPGRREAASLESITTDRGYGFRVWPFGPSRNDAFGLSLLLALAFPAVLINLGHGHNGFLTAALIGGGLALLDSRPLAAGILFGLLGYKPQFGIMIPLVLMATGRWRSFLAATATVALLVLATLLAFGIETWRAFFESMHLTRVAVLESGATGWHKIQSVFAWVRLWGGGVTLAYAAQGAAMAMTAAALIWLWRSGAAFGLKAAALALGAILATPYSLDYDMMVLAPAIAFLAACGLRRGFRSWEKSALALLWFMPLIARSVAEYAFVPLGIWTMLGVFALVLRRAAGEAATAVQRTPLPTP